MSRLNQIKLLSPILLALILSLCLNCAPRAKYVPLDTKNLKGSGKIYFVPLGDFRPTEIEKLIAYYKSKYGLSIETLPHLAIDSTVMNSERLQLTAEAVIASIKDKNPALANDPQAILIGLTTEDMYIARYDWQFTFSGRQEGRYAVVSNARMSLGKPSADKAHSRLRKMVTKNIGILYYRLPPNDDPRSVLYKNVGGISELDAMGEEF
jgi:predicted Zn-dependent protease